MKSRLLFWLPPLAWAGLVAFASSRPVPVDVPSGIPHLDKIAHFCIYAVLSLLIYRAGARGHGWRPRTAALAAFGLATLYGISDEIHQYFVPSRHCEIADVLANSLGAACAALWAAKRRAFAPPRKSTEP